MSAYGNVTDLEQNERLLYERYIELMKQQMSQSAKKLKFSNQNVKSPELFPGFGPGTRYPEPKPLPQDNVVDSSHPEVEALKRHLLVEREIQLQRSMVVALKNPKIKTITATRIKRKLGVARVILCGVCFELSCPYTIITYG